MHTRRSYTCRGCGRYTPGWLNATNRCAEWMCKGCDVTLYAAERDVLALMARLNELSLMEHYRMTRLSVWFMIARCDSNEKTVARVMRHINSTLFSNEIVVEEYDVF
jgi:hypothetical protein